MTAAESKKVPLGWKAKVPLWCGGAFPQMSPSAMHRVCVCPALCFVATNPPLQNLTPGVDKPASLA